MQADIQDFIASQGVSLSGGFSSFPSFPGRGTNDPFLFGVGRCEQPRREYLVSLPQIIFNGRTFDLNTPIEFVLANEGGTWSCEASKFSILAFGETMEKAVYSFCEDFSVLWDLIAQSADDQLAPDAINVKSALIRTVKSVTAR
jgi:hypothetical protein